MLRSILRISIIVVLIAYMLLALGFTSRLAETRVCRGMEVRLIDDKKIGFVRTGELIKELGNFYTDASGYTLTASRLTVSNRSWRQATR